MAIDQNKISNAVQSIVDTMLTMGEVFAPIHEAAQGFYEAMRGQGYTGDQARDLAAAWHRELIVTMFTQLRGSMTTKFR